MGSLWRPNVGWINQLGKELQSRRFSLQLYRMRLEKKREKNFLAFLKHHREQIEQAQQELENLHEQSNQTYWHIIEDLALQRSILSELDRRIYRPNNLDESLEEFCKVYNDTINSWVKQVEMPIEITENRDVQSLHHQIRSLNKRLQRSWKDLLRSSSRFRSDAERQFNVAAQELKSLQSKMIASLIEMENSTQLIGSLPKSLSKEDIRRSEVAISQQLRKIEREGKDWLHGRVAYLNESIRAMQDRMTLTKNLFKEVEGKKRMEVVNQAFHDVTLKRVLDLLHSNANGRCFSLVYSQRKGWYGANQLIYK